MVKNYVLVALRSLRKNKFFSIINIAGLSVGIAASLLILNYLRFEESYDQIHVNRDRIFRVPMEITEKGQPSQSFAFTYPAVAAALKNDFPEVEEAIRFRKTSGLITVEDKVIPDLKGFWVDEQIFRVFSWSCLRGDLKTALSQLNAAVLTRTTALKLFGESDPRGKTFSYRNQLFSVSAILEDIPENSHMKFDFLLPYRKYSDITKNNGGDAEGNWHWSDFYTYLLLKPAQSARNLESKFSAFAKRHMEEDMKANGYEVAFHLQPLSEIHAHSRYDYELEGNGDFAYLRYVGIAGFFILFMAWLNYVNLSTSRSLERSKEVGVRKAVGAVRLELIKQFLLESLIVNMLAILVGMVLLIIVNPFLADLIGKPLSIPPMQEFSFWGVLLVFLLVGAIGSGFYPAFVLSSFKPYHALKGRTISAGQSKGVLRKSLVVIQVSLAVILISETTGLLRQVQFMHDQDLGVNIKQTLVLRDRINRDSASVPVVDAFLIELKKNTAITSITASTDVPGKEIGGSSGYRRKESLTSKRCRNFEIDENFFGNYELPIIAGRGFTKEITNTGSVVLNETAVKVLGFENPDEAINHQIVDDQRRYTVIGVVKDYHQESLQFDFNPTVFFLQKYGWDYYSLKVGTNDMARVIATAEVSWKQFFPDSPFDYFFLDEYYNAQYKSELTFGVMLTAFTFLGILVAGLGLLGLSSFTVAKRAKEIGVRKILGASSSQIVTLVTKEYLILVSISFGVAIPFAVMMLNKWLEGYAFRITLGLWFFLIPFFLILAITLLSVGVQSIRAAGTNPVDSLKSE